MILTHIASVAAFAIVTFAVQGLSHFKINKTHYQAVDFLRPDPILPLGIGTMLIQGLVMSLALAALSGGHGAQLRDGVLVSMSFGLVLVSYMGLAEPSKYRVPAVGSWVRVELVMGAIQFGVYGILLGAIHGFLGA